MRRIYFFLAFFALSCAPVRHVVVLSTNDMHGHIENFPRLATAVQACRDTVPTLLLDAGDRWTGNVYVDRAPGRLPVIHLMNALHYDAATLGNHEFDPGQEVLKAAIETARFPVVCSNMQGLAIPASAMLDRGDVIFEVAGAVTNEGPGGHPDGYDEIFEGLTFVDPVATLEAIPAERGTVRVALTHIGLNNDLRLKGYDLIVGGHTHDMYAEGRVMQAGSNLRYVGVCDLSFRGRKLKGKTVRLKPLSDVSPDPAFERMVQDYYGDPWFSQSVGTLREAADTAGVANLFLQALRAETDAEIAIYHRGGIRRDRLEKGDLKRSDVLDLDPFVSRIVRAEMTPEQLGRIILEKFNSRRNVKESHRIDIYASTPYDVLVGEDGEAVDVRFPALEPGRKYSIAMGDYLFRTYDGMTEIRGEVTRKELPDALLEAARTYRTDNTSRQKILRVTK